MILQFVNDFIGDLRTLTFLKMTLFEQLKLFIKNKFLYMSRPSTKKGVFKKSLLNAHKIGTVQRGIILSIPLERSENFAKIWYAQFFSTVNRRGDVPKTGQTENETNYLELY